jgi:hypothetical protein
MKNASTYYPGNAISIFCIAMFSNNVGFWILIIFKIDADHANKRSNISTLSYISTKFAAFTMYVTHVPRLGGNYGLKKIRNVF